MPSRIARSSVQITAPKNARNKNRKRNLDAYSIASHSAKEKSRIAPNRLGEYLDDAPKHKRRRAGEDEEGEESVEEEVPTKRRRTAEEEGVEHGSDSEGNEWTLGGLAEDDEDSDLDSDEAFGESDEEKFEGFAFRGSSSGKKKPVKRKPQRHVGEEEGDGFDLDEEDAGDEGDDEDFGEEGVDLATMLDDEDDEMLNGKDTTGLRPRPMGEESASDEVDEESDSASVSEPEEEEEEDDDDEAADEERVARMRDRLDALDANQHPTTPKASSQPTTLSVDDLLADLDPSARKQFSAALKTRKKSERPTTLPAPLPKRQQDRLNREVASKKAKEQLDRWRDTVIHNRRAEFLSFPLKDPNGREPLGKEKFVQDNVPQNELEKNIQRIMEESGISARPGAIDDDAEESLIKSEELATNKMPIEEVMQRRAELRRTRELLFREEIKAKRIAKIKSKSYRRVHRKEKERMAERERELMGPDEDEKERADRKRAEARMGARHKDSRWARAVKDTNRTVWDEGARDSVNEMARREEELRRRVAGEEVEGSDEASDELSDADESEDGDAAILRQLDSVSRDREVVREGKGLQGMKFMRAADERRRVQNQEDVERLRKELAVQDGDEEESGAEEVEDQGLGRAIFGPKRKENQGPSKKAKRLEMEEGDVSEEEGGEMAGDGEVEAEIVTEKMQPKSILKKTNGTASGPLAKGLRPDRRDPTNARQSEQAPHPVSAWLAGPSKKSKKRESAAEEEALVDMTPTLPAIKTRDETTKVKASRPQAPPFLQEVHDKANTSTDAGDTNGWTLVTYKYNEDADADAESPEPEQSNPILTPEQQKASFHRRAFAGDDVQNAFSAEKDALAASEDEKEESTHLPGWGSWAGEGLSKSIRKANARQKHNPLYKTKLPGGVKPENRKDAKLANVIVSERQERKGKRYLAPVLPHGFETGMQYERALRVPVGPEWTTKEVFQRATRPRVVVKPGVVVEGMERPVL